MNNSICVLAEQNRMAQKYHNAMEHDGYDVVCVTSLESLIRTCCEQAVDLVLVFENCGESSALDALRLLRSRAETLLIPVLVSCSQWNLDLKNLLLQAGAVDVLSEECTERFLCERIGDILSNNQTISSRVDPGDARYRVLVVEDNEALYGVYECILEVLNCDILFAADGVEGWELVREHGQDIDLIISDLYMPRMNGQELCKLVKSSLLYETIPIIVVTADKQEDTLIDLLHSGVTDYITKPFGEAQLCARLQAHLRGCYYRREQQRINNELLRLSASLEEKVRQRTDQLKEANIDTIFKLAVACDYKDGSTANHISRVRYYVQELALAMGCNPTLAEELGYSSMMHDVGKLGIPDRILKKPGPLSEEEWTVMKTHPERGAELLGDNPFYQHARDISLCHHERFDGSGYPRGLKGKEIPFSARLVAVVDIFDALTSNRAYKSAWDIQASLKELGRLKGHHLDPDVVDTMVELVKQGKTSYIIEKWPVNEPC